MTFTYDIETEKGLQLQTLFCFYSNKVELIKNSSFFNSSFLTG